MSIAEPAESSESILCGLIPSVLGFSFPVTLFASLLQEALLCPTILIIGKHGMQFWTG